MQNRNLFYHTVKDICLNYGVMYGMNVEFTFRDNTLQAIFKDENGTADFKAVLVFDNEDSIKKDVKVLFFTDRQGDERDIAYYKMFELEKQILAEKEHIEQGYDMSEWDVSQSNLSNGLLFMDYLENNERFDTLKGRPFPIKEDAPKRRVFFDMDGILAVFNKNATMEEIFTRENRYFERLDPMQSTIDVMKRLKEKGFEPYILSKARGDMIEQKITWSQMRIPFMKPENLIFVPLDASKKDFIYEPNPLDILIDDYNPNLKEWHGLAVKGINGINSHSEEFDCVDLSFYKDYEVLTEEEWEEKVDTVVKEIEYFYEREEKSMDFTTDLEAEIG